MNVIAVSKPRRSREVWVGVSVRARASVRVTATALLKAGILCWDHQAFPLPKGLIRGLP